MSKNHASKNCTKLCFSIFFIVSLTIIFSYLYSGWFWGDKIENLALSSGGNISITLDPVSENHVEIETNTLNEAYFAMGYVHAAKNLFIIELQRRAAKGTLSEILGEKYLDFDKFSSMMQFYSANNLFPVINQDSTIVSLIDSYCEGINNYIETANLGPAFKILHIKPDSFQTQDILSSFLLYQWFENTKWEHDFTFDEIYRYYGLNAFNELISQYDYKYISDVQQPEDLFDILKIIKEFNQFLEHLFGENSQFLPVFESSQNSLIFSDQTRHDSDLNIKITCDSLIIQGQTHFGIPIFIEGNNQAINWKYETVQIKNTYFYTETLTTAGNHYLYNDKWEPVQIVEDTIYVKNKTALNFAYRINHHGPILNDLSPSYKHKPYGLSLKWTGLEVKNDLLNIIQMNLIQSEKMLNKKLKTQTLLTQLISYSSKEMEKTYFLSITTPDMENENSILLSDGSLPENDWVGISNTTESFIQDTNLQNYSSGIKLQNFNDTKLMVRDSLLSLIKTSILFKPNDSPQKLYVYNLLLKPNKNPVEYKLAQTLFESFQYKLIESAFKDELVLISPELYQSFNKHVYTQYDIMPNLLSDPYSFWWDDKSTPDIEEKLSDNFNRAFDFMIQNYLSTVGPDIQEWTYITLGNTNTNSSLIGYKDVFRTIQYYFLRLFPLESPLPEIDTFRSSANIPENCLGASGLNSNYLALENLE